MLVPFWVLATKPSVLPAASTQEPADDGLPTYPTHCLKYRAVQIAVAAPPSVTKGMRVRQSKIHLKVPCMTNSTVVNKGDRLIVDKAAPADMKNLET